MDYFIRGCCTLAFREIQWVQRTSWLCAFWNESPSNLFAIMWWSSYCRALSLLGRYVNPSENWLMDRPRSSYQLSSTTAVFLMAQSLTYNANQPFFSSPIIGTFYIISILLVTAKYANCHIGVWKKFQLQHLHDTETCVLFFVRWWVWWLITFHRAFKSTVLLAWLNALKQAS